MAQFVLFCVSRHNIEFSSLAQYKYIISQFYLLLLTLTNQQFSQN